MKKRDPARDAARVTDTGTAVPIIAAMTIAATEALAELLLGNPA